MRSHHSIGSAESGPILDGTTAPLQPAWEMPSARPMPRLRPRSRDRGPANPGRRMQAIVLGAVLVAVLAAGVAWAISAENRAHSAGASTASTQAQTLASKSGSAVGKASSKKSKRKASSAQTTARGASTTASKASSAATKAKAKTSPAAATKTASATKTTAASAGGSAATALASVSSGSVVVIDAGHQGHGDSSLEPIGPGSSQKKPKVADGASGARAPHAESEINLEVALKLRSELQARGVKVIMVRTSQNVNIANSQRAAIANKAHAALFIRLHCDGVSDSSIHGFSTLVPAKNHWTGPILSASAKAGRIVQAAALKATGAADRGVVNRGDLSGFNWSKVPTVLVEMGFMSNAAEDRMLTTSSYQHKIATGLANGVVKYLKSR